ncbi:MAG: DUF6057 family protein [Planctomycetes bacterium]|nr:DUF6057 family protein [Planctomycetota bacterium]
MVDDRPQLRLADAIRSVVFFGLLYLYLWRVVEPQLIYSCATITNFPVFYKSWPFLRECLSYPGGVLRYINALLPQFFYVSWLGALAITAQAWALWACTGWFLRALAVPRWRLLRFVPALIVLVPYAQYTYHFPTITGALASLLFACLYVAVSSRRSRSAPAVQAGPRWPCDSWAGRPYCGVAVYLVLAVVSYVVSAAAFLPFALLCAIYELLYRRRYIVGLVCLLVAAVLPYAIGVLFFHVSRVNAYTDLLPLSWQVRDWVARRKMLEAVYGLCLFPIAVALLWGFGRAIVAWWSSRRTDVQVPPMRKKSGSPAAKPHWRRFRAPALRWTLESALLFGVSVPVALVSLDGYQKALLAVHYYACQRQWPRVLEVSRRCRDKYVVMNAIDRALYYTGRLNQDMFAWLQHPEGLIYTGEDHGLFYWHRLDTLLDLGLLNLAEKNFTECLEMFGEHPMILQRLALVNLAKGKIEAGRIYLEKLRQTLFFSGWAQDYLQRLAADPTLAGDPQMQQWRAHALRKDFTAGFYAPEVVLSALVEQGSGNRMAFEYLMAWYMMEKRLDQLVKNLGRLRDFGYTALPPLYQEAVMIYATKYPVPLGDFSISPDVQQRIKQFSDVFNRYGRDKNAAFRELAGNFAGSYFFYFIYAASPARQ